MKTKFGTANDNSAGLASFDALLKNIPGITFNCFYAAVDPTNAGTTSQFSVKNIGWNILYNLGYMYSDLKNIIDIFGSSTPDEYEELGGYIGDFIIRFFYSRYNRG
jgi:hypothetical protein